MRRLTAIEFCAGAGGQALGLDAYFEHRLLVDNDKDCCATLTANRPEWNVVCGDMNTFEAHEFQGIDLFAAGLPCPPFSVAGKQLGENDERDLFPAAIKLIKQSQPKFVLIENVRGFLSPSFKDYRDRLRAQLLDLGYLCEWTLLNASDFGVSQLRPRVAIVAARPKYWANFSFPSHDETQPLTVGRLLEDLMSANGWPGVSEWVEKAGKVAPTIVGGSKKHGGPDLGPTRARQAWLELGVNGKSIAADAPSEDFEGNPRLTTRMVARLQGFPDDWLFTGKKTTAYRQIGNAFPPPVARQLGKRIHQAIHATEGSLSGEWPEVIAAE